MSRTGIIVFLFLVVIAIVTGWLKRSTIIVPKQVAKKIYAADFFMDSFRLLQYDETGKLIYKLHGSRMEHFREDGKTIITAPEITMQPDKTPEHWQVNADQAVALSEEMDEITFTGGVVFNRPPATGVAALSLHADHLLIKPIAEYLATNGPVTIVSGQSNLTGENLVADVKQGQFSMQRVTGRYAQ